MKKFLSLGFVLGSFLCITHVFAGCPANTLFAEGQCVPYTGERPVSGTKTCPDASYALIGYTCYPGVLGGDYSSPKPNKKAMGALHTDCFNGVQDEREEGIDCGGSCYYFECELLPEEFKLKVEVIDQTIPVIADGQDTVTLSVSLVGQDSGKTLPLTFEARNSTSGSSGNISSDGNQDGYTVTYTAPDMTGSDFSDGKDFLYAHYTEGESKKYKTYEIPLVLGQTVRASKEGFDPAEGLVLFTGSQAKVNVVIVNAEGEKIPVAGAEVAFKDEQRVFETTDTDGTALLDSMDGIEGDQVAETEIVLTLSAEMKAVQEKAKNQYKQMVAGAKGITNPTVKNFIMDFETALAQTENRQQAENLIVGLQRTGYALLYLTEGESLANDVASELAGALQGQLSDLVDLIGVVDKAKEKAKEKLSSEALDQYEDQAKEKLKSLAPKLMEGYDNLVQKFYSKIIKSLKDGVKRHAPDFPTAWVDDLVSQVIPNPLDDRKGNLDTDKAIDDGQKYIEGQIQESIKNYLNEQYHADTIQAMNQLANFIQTKNFNTLDFEANTFRAKWDSRKMRDQYLTAHEVTYTISGIKDAADLLNNTVGEAGKITGFWKAQAEAAEKAYKVMRAAVLNNVGIYYWFNAYGEVTVKTRSNVNEALGIMSENVSFWDNFEFSLFPVAHAQGTKDSFDLEDLEFYEAMNEINDLLLEVYPEDENLKEVQTITQPVLEQAETIKVIAEKEAKQKAEAQKKIEAQKKMVPQPGLSKPIEEKEWWGKFVDWLKGLFS